MLDEAWIVNRCDEAYFVEGWEMILVESEGSRHLYGNVANGRHERSSVSNHVVTSDIDSINEETGLDRTNNKRYALFGRGEKLSATKQEARRMEEVGLSPHTARLV